MRRRELIEGIAASTLVWPFVTPVRAQQPALPAIGYLGPGSPETDAFRVAAFRKGLKESGYTEGENVSVIYRWAEDHHERLPALAEDLVRNQVTVIVVTSEPGTRSAKAATTTIPIVFETAADPVKLGFVASLSRPGGNVTGVTQLGEEVLPKRLELLHNVLPAVHVMALLVNPADPGLAEPQTRVSLAAAKTFGLELHVLNASSERDFDAVFAKLKDLQAGGLVIGGDALFTGHNDQLAALTLRHSMPAIYQRREFAIAGGLMGYGSNVADTHRLLGVYVGRILKGEKPADLPVHQATAIELYINLKTAKALGITVPISLLGRADEVIE
jgi:putative ABC transport system substrate-binding protein